MTRNRKKGFTLAELLIVVAIIAVLVAIAIPIFTKQLEKARRAVDMQTARNIESILVNAVNDGTIQFPSDNSNYNLGYGVWVMLCRDSSSAPAQYKLTPGGTMFCAGNPGILINGVDKKSWTVYNHEIEHLLSNAGLNVLKLKTTCKGKDKSTDWDWIIIEVGYSGNRLFSRIYSGFAGKDAGMDQVPIGSSNIERQTSRTS